MEISNCTMGVAELDAKLDRTEKIFDNLRYDSNQLRIQLTDLFEKVNDLNNQLHITKTALTSVQVEGQFLTDTISNIREENATLKKENQEFFRSRLENNEAIKVRMSNLQVELEATNGLLAWHQSKEIASNTDLLNITENMTEHLVNLNLLKRQLEESKKTVRNLYAQVTTYRLSKMARLASIFSKNDPFWDSVSPIFNDIKSFTAKHFRGRQEWPLVLSDDLGTMTYREYVIPFKIDRLNKISLAVCPLLPTSQGTIGIEIISSSKQIATQVSLPMSSIQSDIPTEFIMPKSLSDLGKSWLLRVFARNVEVPVVMYELIKYSAFRRHINYRPFISLQ